MIKALNILINRENYPKIAIIKFTKIKRVELWSDQIEMNNTSINVHFTRVDFPNYYFKHGNVDSLIKSYQLDLHFPCLFHTFCGCKQQEMK